MLSNTIVTGNRACCEALHGGGITNYFRLTLNHSTVTSNTGFSAPPIPEGAGIYDFGDFLVLNDSVVSGNTTLGDGGGLFSSSPAVTITNSTFHDNEARRGGGILSTSPLLRIVNSTLSTNEAEHAGGGIYVLDGSAWLFNVTVTENYANLETEGGHYGGGIAKEPGSTFYVSSSILAGNHRIEWSDPFPLLEDSDCSGTIYALAPNFVGATSHPCTIIGFPPATGGFALLGPLTDNGGPTPTHALLPGSPAIDAGGQPNCTDALGAPLTRDQRGTSRPLFGQHGRRCDLGAFEFVGPLFLPLVRR